MISDFATPQSYGGQKYLSMKDFVVIYINKVRNLSLNYAKSNLNMGKGQFCAIFLSSVILTLNFRRSLKIKCKIF